MVVITIENHFLTGKLLIAMPAMGDPRFARSVIYICAHNADGALGLIINKKMSTPSFLEILDQLEISNAMDAKNKIHDVYFGGPVETERGFILHSLEYNSPHTLVINHEVGMTASIEIIKELAAGTGPTKSLLALGYAGWGAGQLDGEIQENAWLSVDPDPDLIFNENVNIKWDKALEKVGVSAALLSSESGHA